MLDELSSVINDLVQCFSMRSLWKTVNEIKALLSLCLLYMSPIFSAETLKIQKWKRPKITALGHSSSYYIWVFQINLFELVQEAVWESLMVLRQTILPLSHQRKLLLNGIKNEKKWFNQEAFPATLMVCRRVGAIWTMLHEPWNLLARESVLNEKSLPNAPCHVFHH